jgi:uroporphyrinogen III methyltransferase/synthase
VTVYLVGAGPGDPGLITVRGKELLEQAQVVVYDRLSAAVFLDMAPADAERINVGKTPGHPAITQEEINAILVDKGRTREVVRLKGGDPFVFGRGGEECEALAAAGVRFEVVPGVTSASAAPAYAGVPLTQRGTSASVTIVTGHEDGDTAGNADWDAVARMGRSGGTIVVLMGAAERGEVAQRLLAGGMDEDTAVTAVTWGTRPEQVVVRTTLGGLADAEVHAPVTIVIGAVAALADSLHWFQLPLDGARVVIAAPGGESSDADSYSARIAAVAERIGADIAHVVTGTRAEPTDGGAHLRDAVARATQAAWITFASAASVDAFAEAAGDGFAFGDALVGTVGDTTAAAFERRFARPPDLVADPPRGAALAAAIGAAPDEGATAVFVVGAEDGRPELADGLAAAGWKPQSIAAYRLGPPPLAEVPARDAVYRADLIVCTSSSAATFLVTHAGLITARAPIVAIGPTTADTLHHAGINGDRVRVAASPAVEDVVAALVESRT